MSPKTPNEFKIANMFRKGLNAFLSCYFVCVFSFEDILYAHAGETTDMSEKGKAQYLLLQARGDLPQYGDCWKNAIRHVNEGCRQLSEETQSEIALYLTNCFLEMSGQETYNCQLDKKPNLRGICINTMTDRAFNVYTEFYTHTQNICYFLRGQIWHETIAENTIKLGEQLHNSALNQEKLLEIQRESIELQKNMKEFFEYLSQKHKDFDVLSSNFKELQSWLLGEFSWFDTFIFYFTTSTMIMFFTSLKRTSDARFPMLATITLNALAERIMGFVISLRVISIFDSHSKYYNLIWFSRYTTLIILCSLLLYKYFTYKNYLVDNNTLLEKIYKNLTVLNSKLELYPKIGNTSILSDSTENTIGDPYKNLNGAYKNVDFEKPSRSYIKRENNIKNIERMLSERIVKTSSEMRYNLRNRSATPEVVQKSI